MNTPQIQIAICTCRRPRMLRDCLKSIFKMRLPEQYLVSVVIIDNDNTPSAKTTVNEAIAIAPIDIHYVSEPNRGIPIARNRAIGYALEHGINFLVFIDDDEQVTQNWLINLVNYAEKKGGDAVIHGQVISKLPPRTPNYLMPFFSKRLLPTDTPMGTCATDNVLIPLRLIARHNLRFNETHPLSGGTDTLFFSAAHKCGIKIYSCTEAIVHETIPPSRASLRWLSQRKYRIGLGRATRLFDKKTNRSLIILRSSIRIILKSISSLLYLIFGKRKKSIKSWLKTCQAAGTISGLLGFKHAEYSKIHGN